MTRILSDHYRDGAHFPFCSLKHPACGDKLTIMKSLSPPIPSLMAARDMIVGHDKSWVVIEGV